MSESEVDAPFRQPYTRLASVDFECEGIEVDCTLAVRDESKADTRTHLQ